MPFEDITEVVSEIWKGAAIAEAVASHLEAVGYEVVATTERNLRFKEKGLSVERPLTRAVGELQVVSYGTIRQIPCTWSQPPSMR